MLSNPATKYIPFKPFERDFSERTWPTKRITHPPIWMSTDLRDGNQSLIEPMSVERKLRFFDMLLKIGKPADLKPEEYSMLSDGFFRNLEFLFKAACDSQSRHPNLLFSPGFPQKRTLSASVSLRFRTNVFLDKAPPPNHPLNRFVVSKRGCRIPPPGCCHAAVYPSSCLWCASNPHR